MFGYSTGVQRQYLNALARRDRKNTILEETMQRLLHEQIGVEEYQPEADRQRVIDCSGFNRLANHVLRLAS
jgi:hypothetical protein